jgi:hypothetical protein
MVWLLLLPTNTFKLIPGANSIIGNGFSLCPLSLHLFSIFFPYMIEDRLERNQKDQGFGLMFAASWERGLRGRYD